MPPISTLFSSYNRLSPYSMGDLIDEQIDGSPQIISPDPNEQSGSDGNGNGDEDDQKPSPDSPDSNDKGSVPFIETTTTDANENPSRKPVSPKTPEPEPEKKNKEISEGEVTDSSEKEENLKKVKKKKRKMSRSPIRSRSQKRRRRPRSSSSSSRGTFEDFEIKPPGRGEEETDDAPYKCDQCGRGKLYTIKEVAEHEIRAHDARVPCMHCNKKSESVAKLASHLQDRHPNDSLTCYFCKQDFKKASSSATKEDWETFRKHVYQEVLKKKMYVHASKESRDTDQVALRGVGRCPHGPPVKCKNFPNCPGDRCIYSHGLCRFDRSCQKTACPFDHSNRPRTCMACLNDLKGSRTTSNARSRH